MKSFNQFLKEYQIYSVNPDGSKIKTKIEKLNYIHSELQKSLGYSNVVEISDLFHDKYKKSNEYVSMSGKKDKFSNEKIRNLLKQNLEIEYPSVDVCDQGNINFVNGKHRYAVSNRLKMERKVCLSDVSLETCKKHGYVK